MAFTNYYQPTYQPYSMQTQQPSQANNSIIWVQGINAAKSFPLGAGQSGILFDSESNTFYIKSTDQSGMPLPLRIFDYTERTAQPTEQPQIHLQTSPANDFITREEFEQRLSEFSAQATVPRKATTTTRKEKE